MPITTKVAHFCMPINNKYKWISELRTHHTQHLAQVIANSGTRIGADKFEWFRINSKRGDPAF